MGGCFNINGKTEQEKAQEGTTPVQDYVGQGYSFVDGNKSAERVKKHEDEIKQEAIDYMKTKYKTNVKVNNVVPARNARSEEEEVEKAIVGGLYAKAYQTEFEHLDIFAERIAKKYNLLGRRNEAINKTASVGYEKEYYFIATAALYFPSVYSAYLENQEISVDDLKVLFLKDDPQNKKMAIAMNFFSKKDSLPKEEIANNLATEIQNESGLPKGNYETTVYKNLIVNRAGLPDGESIDAKDIIK
ncbi:DUF1672 family protein [Listeria marthii]|uniref:DUF1672 family protein n=1 Tax=Listeria marthii TaxID=529731 RepID=UPI002880B8EB|nr:DUF1672 family protein [Listeria marthii]MDT0091291.1 DUF1672 family protein [Listeria marthii]